MGTDITAYAERRQPDGSWVLVNGLRPNTSYFLGGAERYSEEENDPWPPLIPVEAFDMVRNYELFAILANVRNGIRTAGGVHFECISLPRGLPEDLSLELRKFTNLLEDGNHSHTWMLLEEILTFSWKEKSVLREAMVDSRVAHLFGYEQNSSSKQKWQSPDQPRAGFPFREWPEEIRISYATYLRDGVTVQWLETYEEIAGDFFELLEPLSALGDPADTRLVFWFD